MSNNYKRIIHICFGVGLLFAAMTPQAIQTSSESPDNPASSWSQSQIELRIQELEAEHAQRLALMQGNKTEASQEVLSGSVNTISQVLPNILVLLGICAVPALLLLLWQVKRAQPVVIFDWERTVTLQATPECESGAVHKANSPVTRHRTPHSSPIARPASARKSGAFPDTFDSICVVCW